MATTRRQRAGGRRIATSLVALSSAVITSVYAAGYIRTQAAASRPRPRRLRRRPSPSRPALPPPLRR